MVSCRSTRCGCWTDAQLPDIRKRPSALLIDLDGTVLDSRDVISDRVIEAVREAARLLPVAVASGRVREDVGHYARLLGLDGLQICDNGAVLMEALTGRSVFEMPIERDHAELIVDRLESEGSPYFAVDAGRTVRSRDDFVEWRVTMITTRAPDIAAAHSMVRELTGGGVRVIASQDSRGEWYIDYTRSGVDKGRGAAVFAELVGVQLSEVMAIGDGPNDIELFDAVGLPVAMDHAPDELKRRAVYVTGALESDGVAEAIERFVI